KELETALLLVDQLTTEFNPEKYTDDYRTALMELIEEKKVSSPPIETDSKQQPAAASNVTDLMAALQASLDKTKKKKTPARKRTPKAKTS
ncbi:MAG: Ku protein, partial [Psychrobacillus sp.]